MRKLGENIILYVIGIAAVVALAPIIEKIPRTRGTNIVYHGAFLGAAILSLILLPGWIKSEFFSPGGVVIIGTILPVCKFVFSLS
jgi:hypothetical protein